ncbi:ABC transporter transmembrane domain-containing protein [Enterovirga rhinocerotis]|uniref:ABC transporter transmembrane domain-containing protein n=1 Tax=Enterovirga rhinocerotis TaxID=1339210 RepID=UPI00315C5E95
MAWQMARSLLRLGFSGTAAVLAGRLIMGSEIAAWMVPAPPLLLVLAALAGWVADRIQAETEAGVANGLREEALARLRALPARSVQAVPVGELLVGLQRHPESIAALVVGHRVARLMLALGPLAAAAAILGVSWQAALLVLGLTPVMIIFFAFIGDAIRRRAKAQEKALGRLAGQFADRIRTLPTILAHHALGAEEAKLRIRLDAYAGETMGVLRVAFLNAGVIDFFSSLSIAILAVFLGLGHLGLASIPGFSDLALWQSLFILMIAPEYFAPFRRYAEQYHAKAEGDAAADALDRLLEPAPPPAADLPHLDRIAGTIALPPGGLVAVSGASGSGKSTLLRRLAGLEPGIEAAPGLATVSWAATDSYVPDGDLGAAIAWGTDAPPEPSRLLLAAGQVGLLDDTLLPGGLGARVENGGGNLSGGQRLRIAIARALLTDRPVIADEPTAKLDPATAALVRDALRDMARSRLVLVATHDGALLRLADMTIHLDPADQPARESAS